MELFSQTLHGAIRLLMSADTALLQIVKRTLFASRLVRGLVILIRVPLRVELAIGRFASVSAAW